jgi:methylmalonyl-CoA mutase
VVLSQQLIEGTIIKEKFSESAAKEQELFDSGKEVLFGTVTNIQIKTTE